MKWHVGAFLLLCTLMYTNLCAQGERFKKRVLVSNLNSPWEILYGPHDSLWVTECVNYTVDRVDVKSGKKTILLNLSRKRNFVENKGKWPQGGMMGLALHPYIFSKDSSSRKEKPWVYVAYVYEIPGNQECAINSNAKGPCYFKTKIERYEYFKDTLINPVTIIDNIPGSNDHNAGRLVIGPAHPEKLNDENPEYSLYYTIGDMGAGQFNNMKRVNNAQNKDVLEGKIIRLNTEPKGERKERQWIPDDNPFNQDSIVTAQDYVYTLGHRNPQGLVGARVGGQYYLYSSEHGPQSDDEINLIRKGGNYGWNKIAGYRDNNYKGMQLGGEGPVDEIEFPQEVIDPLYTLKTVSNEALQALSSDSYTWPTVAPSSIDYYASKSIPGWENSLLVTTLKAGKVFRIKLNDAGTDKEKGLLPELLPAYFSGEGRFRDIAISPDGNRFFVACDKGGRALGIRGKLNKEGSAPRNSGSILEFRYIPEKDKRRMALQMSK